MFNPGYDRNVSSSSLARRIEPREVVEARFGARASLLSSQLVPVRTVLSQKLSESEGGSGCCGARTLHVCEYPPSDLVWSGHGLRSFDAICWYSESLLRRGPCSEVSFKDCIA